MDRHSLNWPRGPTWALLPPGARPRRRRPLDAVHSPFQKRDAHEMPMRRGRPSRAPVETPQKAVARQLSRPLFRYWGGCYLWSAAICPPKDPLSSLCLPFIFPCHPFIFPLSFLLVSAVGPLTAQEQENVAICGFHHDFTMESAAHRGRAYDRLRRETRGLSVSLPGPGC